MLPRAGAVGEQRVNRSCEGRRPTSLVELRRGDGRLELVITPKGGFPKKDSPPQPAPPPLAVAFYERDRLYGIDDPGEAEFLRAPDGSIAWFRVGGRVMARTG
mgnify:CR=1 FL=1